MSSFVTYSLYPPRNAFDWKCFELYQKQNQIYWVSTEFNPSLDKKCYDNLSQAKKKLIDGVLLFFLIADGIISENIAVSLCKVPLPMRERKRDYFVAFLSIQDAIENVHAETYGKFINTFLPDEDDDGWRHRIDQSHSLKKKLHFMQKYMTKEAGSIKTMTAAACMEGIFFRTLFLFVFWFAKNGELTEFSSANEAILRDELLHKDMYALICRNIGFDMNIVKEAVEIEIEYAKEFCPLPTDVEFNDLQLDEVKNYIMIVGNDLVRDMGGSSFPFTTHSSSFTWLNTGTLQQKASFYERKVTAYQRPSESSILSLDLNDSDF